MFARAQANRIWAHLMGRGIVDPIDDVRDTNPPSHPELLEALADELVSHGYDMRHLIRVIMHSRTYQLASTIADADELPDSLFARAIVRRLPAEQLLDALTHVADASVPFNGYPEGIRAGQIAGVRAVRSRERAPSAGDAFLRAFGKPPRLQSCECERSNDATLAQTFQLISGPLMNELIARTENRLGRLLERGTDPAAIADELWWTAVSRAPTNAEHEAAVLHVSQSATARAGWEDVLWALLNSNEFLLRR